MGLIFSLTDNGKYCLPLFLVGLCFSARLGITFSATFGYGISYLIRSQLSVVLLCMVRDELPVSSNVTANDSSLLTNGTSYEDADSSRCSGLQKEAANLDVSTPESYTRIVRYRRMGR